MVTSKSCNFHFDVAPSAQYSSTPVLTKQEVYVLLFICKFCIVCNARYTLYNFGMFQMKDDQMAPKRWSYITLWEPAIVMVLQPKIARDDL